jgi:hypothetical protein
VAAARKDDAVLPRSIAGCLAEAEEEDEAFQWLNIALKEHDRGLIELKTAPRLDSLRSDPRFAELAKKMGLP